MFMMQAVTASAVLCLTCLGAARGAAGGAPKSVRIRAMVLYLVTGTLTAAIVARS
jgi:hypothetical protein